MKLVFKFALRIFPSSMPKGAKILELGCGTSEFACILRNLGYEVLTADINLSKAVHSGELGFTGFCADFNRNLPLSGAKFDAVVMLEVIEHINKAEDFMFEVYRILKPGGFLILSTPNFSHYHNRFSVLLGKPPFGEGYHYRFFTRMTLLKIIRDSGFSINKWITSSYLPFLNRVRKTVGLEEAYFVAPGSLAGFIGNNFFLLARKPDKHN